ncbi:MAG: polysaccharide deacetylase family protein [Bacteroidetes bacterium]|nr:polysaccharide deacetylase family protein [Bacteroidota bacterium]
MIKSLITLVLFVLTFSSFCQNDHKSTADNNGEFVCFVYHRFGDDRYPSTNISSEVFRQQLQYLKNNHFHVLSLGETIQALKSGKGIPEKTVVLTIDDGYKSFLTAGLPILKEFGYPATLFVNTKTAGGGDYLSWEELKQIADEAIEIGNHSHSHSYFLNLDKDELARSFREDVESAQKIFRLNLHLTPKVFSYPYGEFNKEMITIIRDLGFLGAAAQNSGVVYKESDLYALPRFPMGGPFATLEGFKSKANMHALPVIWEKPESLCFSENPPELTICLDPLKIRKDQIQCFIHGSRKNILKKELTKDGLVIRMRADQKLSGRRTLYTITAPLADGSGWCWYSHLWVNTEVSE